MFEYQWCVCVCVRARARPKRQCVCVCSHAKVVARGVCEPSTHEVPSTASSARVNTHTQEQDDGRALQPSIGCYETRDRCQHHRLRVFACARRSARVRVLVLACVCARARACV